MLPVLDLALVDQGEEAAERFRAALLAASHDIGFFYLVGHGIPAAVTTRAFDTARAFFDLPLDDKLSVEMVRSPHFRGYTRTGGELTQGRTDWREQIDIGAEREPVTDPAAAPYLRLEGPNLWPEAMPELRTVFTDWETRCSHVGRTLLRQWAVALGSAPGVFDDAFARPSTLIKLVRYPGRVDGGRPAQGVGAHQDPGVLTLLLVEPGKAGLQVEHDGTWLEAPAVEGAFVVNLGELLEFATGGYLRATVHRVQSPPPGQTRLSIPFFLNPALDSRMPSLVLPPHLAAQARGVSDDPANVISGTFGDNLLKARLRAHPDVAAAHHPDLVGPRDDRARHP
ncbi:MAG TPA: 2-oxoglutarate and iron-dependent oxygenase domain-containing protein [Dermatophilaceae bacterium]|nr:2-oxoglutarate and iron-dependent oxygenase domain-containing protein [Dermatophilaceae bacterium]